MSDQSILSDQSALIVAAAITSVSTTVASIFAAWFSYKSKVMARETHKIVNSELAKWKEAVRETYRHEGAMQEQSDVRDRANKEKGKL